MKATHQAPVKLLKKSPFWLLGIAAGLIAIHLTLTWRAGIIGYLGLSVLSGLASWSLLWEKRHSLNLESGIIPSFLGVSLIAWVLWKSAGLTEPDFVRLSPLISAVGLALLASGFKGLKQYWQELTIFFFLGMPKLLISSLIDIYPLTTKLTAQFSTFILWYSGFEVSRQGIEIVLPGSGVQVAPECSGTDVMTYMLTLAVICLVMFPLPSRQQIFAPIVAVVLGFAVNGIRVAVLAVLGASNNQELFDYWHRGDAAQLFTLIPVLIFCLFYLFVLRQGEPSAQSPED